MTQKKSKNINGCQEANIRAWSHLIWLRFSPAFFFSFSFCKITFNDLIALLTFRKDVDFFFSSFYTFFPFSILVKRKCPSWRIQSDVGRCSNLTILRCVPWSQNEWILKSHFSITFWIGLCVWQYYLKFGLGRLSCVVCFILNLLTGTIRHSASELAI